MFCPDKVFGEEKLNKIKVTQCDSLLEFNVLPVINTLSVHNIIATVHAGQPADMPSPDLADDVSDTRDGQLRHSSGCACFDTGLRLI